MLLTCPLDLVHGQYLDSVYLGPLPSWQFYPWSSELIL